MMTTIFRVTLYTRSLGNVVNTKIMPQCLILVMAGSQSSLLVFSLHCLRQADPDREDYRGWNGKAGDRLEPHPNTLRTTGNIVLGKITGYAEK